MWKWCLKVAVLGNVLNLLAPRLPASSWVAPLLHSGMLLAQLGMPAFGKAGNLLASLLRGLLLLLLLLSSSSSSGPLRGHPPDSSEHHGEGGLGGAPHPTMLSWRCTPRWESWPCLVQRPSTWGKVSGRPQHEQGNSLELGDLPGSPANTSTYPTAIAGHAGTPGALIAQLVTFAAPRGVSWDVGSFFLVSLRL